MSQPFRPTLMRTCVREGGGATARESAARETTGCSIKRDRRPSRRLRQLREPLGARYRAHAGAAARRSSDAIRSATVSFSAARATALAAAPPGARRRPTAARCARRRSTARDGLHALLGRRREDAQQVMLANADADLLDVFVRFLRCCYGVENDRIALSVNCFVDNGLTRREIEHGGLIGWSCRPTCLRTAVVNRASSASQAAQGPRASVRHRARRVTRRSWSRASTARSRSTPASTARSGWICEEVGRLGLEPRTTGLTCRTGFHRPPPLRDRRRGLAVWTISSPSAGPVRVGGVWPLRALPHGAGLPADRPIRWDRHRPRAARYPGL